MQTSTSGLDTPKRTIGSMALKFGVSQRSLRFYEELGLLMPLRRGSERVYSAADEIKLELILRGKRLGLSLKDIEHLVLTAQARSEAENGRLSPPLEALSVEMIEAKTRELVRRYDEIVSAIADLEAYLASQPVQPGAARKTTP